MGGREGECVGERVGVAVPEGDTVAVAEEEREMVGVMLGLAPRERVAVGVAVGEREGEGVGEAVGAKEVEREGAKEEEGR